MRKIFVFILLLIISNLNLSYAMASDYTRSTDSSTKPYEKVAAKGGEWYIDRIQYDNTSNLVIGYLGEHKTENVVSEIEFKVKEKIIVTGIYLPVISGISEIPSIQIKDAKGNIYQGFSGRKEIESIALSTAISTEETVTRENLIYTSNSDIVFDKGEYIMQLSIPDITVGAYLIKGLNYEGYERYLDKLREQVMKDQELAVGNTGESVDGVQDTVGSTVVSVADQQDLISITGEKVIGDETLGEDVAISIEPVTQNSTAEKKPAMFGLDAEYGIDEIIINTYNNGKGLEPGTISIIDESGTMLLTEQASGNTFADVPNGMWRIAPNVLLPEGIYYIVISEPEAWTYDENMEPLFYVKASVPIEESYNFTGTYKMDLDAYKSSTLMGSVSSKQSSFSLKDFELTVLDREAGLELIGKYEGMPFSQICEIVERTEDKVVGKFNFGADLSKLPYNVAIGANLVVLIEKQGSNPPIISISGEALYTREETQDKGADRNTYDVVAKGVFKQKELPAFVVAALGKSSGVGNIPGPDNTTQASTGILFPPLVGLMVNVLTELLKKKDVEEAAQRVTSKKSVKRDKKWYMEQNPGKTDEEIAMIMLADAMGNTDEPDEGDSESIGDNEIAEAKTAVKREEQEEYEREQAREEQEYEEEQAQKEARRVEEDKRIEEAIKKEEEESTNASKASKEAKGTEEATKASAETEPEIMVLQTSANGAQELYVKDPNTGKWHNAATGSELDYEDYKNRVVNEMNENKDWNDAEFEKNSKGEMEQDKLNREKMKEIDQDAAWEEHKEKMRDKYHEDNLGKIEKIIEAEAMKEKENFEKWQTIGDIAQVGETGAKAVSAGADIGVDILAEATGSVGKGIKAGYKVIKSTAANVAEKQVTRKDGATWGDAVEGFTKGTGDAATDFINIDNKYAQAAAKAATNIVSETGGSMAGAAMNGEDVIEAGKAGLVDGVTKATVNTVSDAIAGDTPLIPKGASTKEAMKKVIVNKFTATKATTAVVDEVTAKPAAQELKDFIKNEPNKKK